MMAIGSTSPAVHGRNGRMVRSILRAVACLTLSCASLVAQEIPLTELVKVTGQESYRFASVPSGGVEYATGMVWSARRPENLVIRADGGGIWRLDRSTNKRWICLTDNIPFSWRDLTCVDSVAVHPDNPDIIYIAGGGRWAQLHDILKTEDGGKTWKRLNVQNPAGKPVVSDGNGELKQAGERLVIDINSPEVLFFATRKDGLLTSKDGGTTWEAVASFPEKGKPWVGLTFVAGDFATGKQGSPTQRWYVGVCPDRRARIRGGLYVTEDAGATWSRVLDGPGLESFDTILMRARITPTGTMYLTTLNDRVWRRRGEGWVDITPARQQGKPFCGINFDPSNPDRLLVAETGGQFDNTFYLSQDGGDKWKRYHYNHESADESNVRLDDYPAWEKADGTPGWGGNASDIAFDPIDSGRVWHMSFAGPCRIDGVGGDSVTVSLVGEGREQLTCGEVISPTSGAPLISGVWDVGGFRHTELDRIPLTRLRRQERDGSWSRETWRRAYQDVFDLDVQPGDADHVVLCGGWQWNQTGEAAYSVDNGRTFREFDTRPFDGAKFGRIAIGVDPANVVWAPAGNATTSVFYTQDNGRLWFPSEGSPLGMIATEGVWSLYRCLAADRVKPGVFYLYDRRDGRFYRSKDGGARFRQVSMLPAQSGVHSDWHRLESTPWREGDLWLSMRERGLYHSTDGGNSWRKMGGIQWAENIAMGKPRKEGDYPTLYLFGQIGGEVPTSTTVDCRLYRSEDGGRSWLQISDDSMQFATIGPGFTGDMQTFGRVYLATNARGIFYGEPQP